MALATRNKKATSCRDNQITTTDAVIALRIAVRGECTDATAGGGRGDGIINRARAAYSKEQ